MSAREEAMSGVGLSPGHRPIGNERTLPGTVNDALARYYQATAFTNLSATTRGNRRAIAERFRVEHGTKRISALRDQHVAAMLGQMKPNVQKNWLKTLRGFMAFAVANGLLERDPTLSFKPARAKDTGGFLTWDEEHIATFEARHPLGTRERLAFALLLYTGQRRSDVIRMGSQHLRDGKIQVQQQKTGARLAIPLHPELEGVLSATPRYQMTFLVTRAGARSRRPASATCSARPAEPPGSRISQPTDCARRAAGASLRRAHPLT